jgi:hypothetical protein
MSLYTAALPTREHERAERFSLRHIVKEPGTSCDQEEPDTAEPTSRIYHNDGSIPHNVRHNSSLCTKTSPDSVFSCASWQFRRLEDRGLGTPHALHCDGASARAQGKGVARFAGTMILFPPLNQGQAAARCDGPRVKPSLGV